VFVTFVLIFKFIILIYLLHVLLVFKTKGFKDIFKKKTRTQKYAEMNSFFLSV